MVCMYSLFWALSTGQNDPAKCEFEAFFAGCVRYGTVRTEAYRRTAGITGTEHFGMFGTSIPVPDTSVSSVRQYRYRTLRYVGYDMDTGTAGTCTDFHTGTGYFGKFGTSIPVPNTSLSSVRYLSLIHI